MTAPKPMLCHESPGKDFVLPGDGSGWIIEKKLDGWRFLFDRTEDRVLSYAGRNGSDRTGQAPGVEQALEFLPPGTVLDAEVVAVNPNVAVSSALADGLPVTAVVFDVLSVAGTDVTKLPWTERRKLLETAGAGFDGENVALSLVYPPDPSLHEAWVEAGEEGSVAKREAGLYVPGKRSWDWLKIKPQKTAEAVVTGWKEGTGSNAGTWSAFTATLLGTGAEFSVGVPDPEYTALNDRPEQFLGKHIEVRHHGISKHGKPRHPIFQRMRPDRDREEVTR